MYKTSALSYFCKYEFIYIQTLVTLFGVDLCQLVGLYVEEIGLAMGFPALRLIPY